MPPIDFAPIFQADLWGRGRAGRRRGVGRRRRRPERLQSWRAATLPECMAMIDDVIASWPTDEDEQAWMFVSSDSVIYV